MAAALTGPVLMAAALLLVSGAAKLRAPQPAVLALRAAGLPGGRLAIRALAAGELGLGVAGLAAAGRATALALATAYAAFAAFALVLARKRAACGCFGDGGAPATPAQALLSGLVAAACGLAAPWPPAGLAWVLQRPPATACGLIIGVAGCVYAAMIAYTALPDAWTAWSGR